MARHGNRALLVALLLLAAAVLVPGGASSDSAPQVRYPDPDIGVDSLAARKKAQTDTADQFKVFYQFHFTDAVKESGITFVHHMVDDSGAFRMLEKKTGMTSDQLQQLYASSGAKNFGQFVSAIVVSKNLNLDTNQVLNGLKTQNLGQTLQSLGVSKDAAKDAIKKANREVKDAEKQS